MWNGGVASLRPDRRGRRRWRVLRMLARRPIGTSWRSVPPVQYEAGQDPPAVRFRDSSGIQSCRADLPLSAGLLSRRFGHALLPATLQRQRRYSSGTRWFISGGGKRTGITMGEVAKQAVRFPPIGRSAWKCRESTEGARELTASSEAPTQASKTLCAVTSPAPIDETLPGGDDRIPRFARSPREGAPLCRAFALVVCFESPGSGSDAR